MISVAAASYPHAAVTSSNGKNHCICSHRNKFTLRNHPSDCNHYTSLIIPLRRMCNSMTPLSILQYLAIRAYSLRLSVLRLGFAMIYSCTVYVLANHSEMHHVCANRRTTSTATTRDYLNLVQNLLCSGFVVHDIQKNHDVKGPMYEP